MKSSESIANLADALVRANLVILNPTKDRTAKIATKTGGSFSYAYVGLDTITADTRPILQAHGLCVVQEAASGGVTTRLLHSSGEWLEFDPLFLPTGTDAQSIGSAITYARRYALCAALGIAADEDDDGAKAKKSPAAHAATKTERTGSSGREGASDAPSVAGATAEPEPSSGSAASSSGVGEVGGVPRLDDPAPLGTSEGEGQANSDGVEPTRVAGEASTANGDPSPSEPSQETHVHGDWTPAPRAGFVICGRPRNGKPCGYAEKATVAAHA